MLKSSCRWQVIRPIDFFIIGEQYVQRFRERASGAADSDEITMVVRDASMG